MHQGMIEELGAISSQQRLDDGRGGRRVQGVPGADLPVRERPEGPRQRGGLARPAHRQRQPDDRVLEADLRQVHWRRRSSRSTGPCWSESCSGRRRASCPSRSESVREKLAVKQEQPGRHRDQQKRSGTDSEMLHKSLLERQVELGKLYGAVVRAEKERAGDEGARERDGEAAGRARDAEGGPGATQVRPSTRRR